MKKKPTPHRSDNIILIGMMGSGKSSIGIALSYNIGWDFVDFDDLIEKKEGRTISEIFSNDGEEYFRKVESNILKEFKGKHIIVATGGGIVENVENIDILKKVGTVFYLKASAEELYKRVQKETHRPLVKDEESFKQILKRREKLYEKADFTIDTTKKRTGDIAEEIYEKING